LDARLWSRVRAVAQSQEARELAGVDRRLLEETIRDFRQAGAELPPEKRERLEALQAELAGATQRFAENVLDSTNAWEMVVTAEERLAGLPEHAKAAARRDAEARGRAGWRFTLHQPSCEPFLRHVEDEALRREMWEANVAVGARAPHDNSKLIGRILAGRAEKAALLGRPHFADVVLERRMAGDGDRALAFLEDLRQRCAAVFHRENAELEEFKAQQTGRPVAPLAPWEVAFWAEKLRRATHNFDEEILRPYLPLGSVIAGLFALTERVFGVSVAEQPEGTFDRWHPAVKYYTMRDRRGRRVGAFYADWHPRETKRGGAWMNTLITGGPRPDGSRAPHLGLICGNLTPPIGEQPALLTHREVETVFHEFGHLLHHLLGEVKYKSLNGVNVAWDFVELPSQLMENWTWERAGLDLCARHHETGAPIPEDIFRRMRAARNFRSASALMRQIAFAKLDLLLHMRTAEFAAAGEIEAAARAAIAECLPRTDPPAPTILKRFNHVFGEPVGYAAGYYSYKWAEVLEADAFTRFRREGIFNEDVGAEFVAHILSRGNSAEPAELFRAFMGREPDPRALLERAGLAA
ncbi:MAG: M3 family metallopeptidase, partial [Verrucomicrobia bacterium]|nr:M3 family metallopeptidase [Verrucomicrobiota bacterium]